MSEILIVENDLNIQQSLQRCLNHANFNTICCNHKNIIQNLEHNKIDAIILDITPRQENDFELCVKIREIVKIPLIITSINSEVSHKVNAFEKGADDYLTKPYDFLELVARIKALLRRIEPQEMIFGFLHIDAKKRIVKLHNELLELTNTEFDILLFLIENRLQPISRDRIAHTINAIHEDTGLRSIDTHIRNLRNKLGDSAKDSKYIQSVWGVGYKFCL
ncbi:DNA-binding response regulator [Helicobacter didelphidarum]|uniref:DNA-binding response regulator n=1 Tax=Helicobacter didelphidarum TaxID=2040648 RepID=A0A3D8IQD4_9HELI|nr:response regulator transcription factor [Helicobacter didelphidarum]RDU67125.1 DNA-binding response regulator [Helicobacter didelphidarum]